MFKPTYRKLKKYLCMQTLTLVNYDPNIFSKLLQQYAKVVIYYLGPLHYVIYFITSDKGYYF